MIILAHFNIINYPLKGHFISEENGHLIYFKNCLNWAFFFPPLRLLRVQRRDRRGIGGSHYCYLNNSHKNGSCSLNGLLNYIFYPIFKFKKKKKSF